MSISEKHTMRLYELMFFVLRTGTQDHQQCLWKRTVQSNLGLWNGHIQNLYILVWLVCLVSLYFLYSLLIMKSCYSIVSRNRSLADISIIQLKINVLKSTQLPGYFHRIWWIIKVPCIWMIKQCIPVQHPFLLKLCQKLYVCYPTMEWQQWW